MHATSIYEGHQRCSDRNAIGIDDDISDDSRMTGEFFHCFIDLGLQTTPCSQGEWWFGNRGPYFHFSELIMQGLKTHISWKARRCNLTIYSCIRAQRFMLHIRTSLLEAMSNPFLPLCESLQVSKKKCVGFKQYVCTQIYSAEQTGM